MLDVGGHSPAISVAAGLAVGILFMIIFIQSVNPVRSFRYGHADNPTAEDKALLDSLSVKARQYEPVKLFLKKYPFAESGIYQYGDFPLYDEEGNETGSQFRAIFVYSGSTITRIEYEEVRTNNLLVSYHHPSLWVIMDRDGGLQGVELRCGISYLDNSGSMGEVIQGYDTVMDFLKARVCWH
jgi:hypothetical protein